MNSSDKVKTKNSPFLRIRNSNYIPDTQCPTLSWPVPAPCVQASVASVAGHQGNVGIKRREEERGAVG